MPVDKAIDSVQLDANLTAVADAIRAKGETAEALAFPDGFVSAIGAIQTGHELNFTVVGGTTEPENPTENTIWVNTDQAITGWVFSHNLPASPFEGMVWIVNGVSGVHEFDAVTDVSLRVQVESVKQYIGGAWVVKTTEVYQNGVWNETILNLYKYGNEYVSTTGGWDKTNSANKYNTYMEIAQATSDGYVYSNMHTKNKVDLTRYTVLNVRMKTAKTSSHEFKTQIAVSSSPSTCTGGSQSGVATRTQPNNRTSEFVATLNIENVTGSYYVALGGGYLNTMYVYEVWLSGGKAQ